MASVRYGRHDRLPIDITVIGTAVRLDSETTVGP